MATQPIPPQYLCPITGEVMRDPVIDREGNSFERTAIETWLARNSASPITRTPMTAGDLAPNRALREAIEAFHQNGGAPPTPIPAPLQTVPLTNPNRPTVVQAENLQLRFVHDPEGRCLLSLVPPPQPPNGDRAPIDIVCVIDVSGSMSTTATVQDDKGKAETHGLTILDVVCHAAKTVANMLQDRDRFAVVTFSDTAKTCLALTKMTKDGKGKVGTVLDGLRDGGQTNLWAGLQTGMTTLLDEAADGKATGRNKTVLLLTDGCPNVEPPRGHLPSLRNFLDKLGPVPPFTLNTFGFGYSLNSKLLDELARELGGLYVFIPDSGLVGTVFVNCVANLLATAASAVQVSVELGTSTGNVLPTLLQPAQFGATGRIGSLLFGQSRDICLHLDPKDLVSGAPFAKVDVNVGGKVTSLTVECQPAATGERLNVLAHSARNTYCAALMAETRAALREGAADTLKSLKPHSAAHPLIGALVADLTGEIAMGLADDAMFSKWGKHYIPSLRRANELQQCNNFKDPSVQQYGGAYFRALRDAGEAVFVGLPPPKPRAPAAAPLGFGGGTRSSVAAAAPPPPANMRQYYNCGGGCVAPSCLVSLANGQTKPAGSIRKGDVLSNGAVVVCNACIRVAPETPMVHLAGGLVISPYHPIRLPASKSDAAMWHFPTEAVAKGLLAGWEGTEADSPLSFVHSFVLKRGPRAASLDPVITVNGVEIVALGHGLTDDAVVAHSYLGTKAVVRDLRRLPGFASTGRVEVGGFRRDPDTMRIVGLVVA